MKLPMILVSLVLALAVAAPAEAAAKKRKKMTVHRPHHGMVHARPANDSYGVYFGGELVGRDPDPAIRSYMQRDPHPWDGPE